MVKIIVLVAILALACVHAQNNNPFARVMSGFGFLGLPIFNLDSMMNRKPGPNENYHVSSMSQQSQGGKVVTTIFTNDNGEKKFYTLNN